MGRCSELMVIELDFGSSGPCSSPGGEHCFAFLGKTRSCSIHPGVKMGTGKFNTGDSHSMDYHHIQG